MPYFLTNFKDYNFDFDKLSFKQNGATFYINAFYISSVETCSIYNSNSFFLIQKNVYQKSLY